MTRFSTNKENRFQRPVYFYSCCHGNGTYVSLTIKKPKFVLLICLLPFLAIERSRVLEKEVNETQVSKTVFSHLNIIDMSLKQIVTLSLAARREYVRNGRIIFLPFLCGTCSRSPVRPVMFILLTPLQWNARKKLKRSRNKMLSVIEYIWDCHSYLSVLSMQKLFLLTGGLGRCKTIIIWGFSYIWESWLWRIIQ